MYQQKKVLSSLFLIVIVSIIVGACTAQPTPNSVQVYPTPTNSPNFDNRTNTDEGKTGSSVVRNLVDLFRDTAQKTSSEPVDPIARSEVSTRSILNYELVNMPIYTDMVNQNWIVQRSTGGEIDLASREESYEGSVSLSYTPAGGIGTLFFTVKQNSSEIYLSDNILGLSFWLNSGAGEIGTGEIAVTVLGSNSYPYWLADDNSVKSPFEPVFSETRLYHLGVNRTIPPHTWVKVELWLDERIYDPDYRYVTGFYIKNEASLQQTIYLDDIQLIRVADESSQEKAEILESGSSQVTDIQPVWTVTVDTERNVHPISPLIYGVSAADTEYLEALRPTLNSWGGNPNTRYNWKIGHAWNAGRDYFFKNGNYGITSGSASDGFIETAMELGLDVRLAVPTLGWVAKNDDLNTCSFPLPNGECSDVPKSTCDTPLQIADPTLANVPSDTESIRDWMTHIFETQGYDLRIVAMDNEPELWGYTHYDVHPECTTYQEILEKYIDYATVVREVAPQVEIAGPVTCCWYYYWNSAAGAVDKLLNGNKHFLPWFLENVRKHDEITGIKTIDVLDIHYYQEGVYNQEIDDETAALRLRSTRSLWDPNYVDESWINQPINLIPLMKEIIEENYPGLKLGISEWNYGADQHMNGALAIADVLGIFGREDLYYASYWTHPPIDNPGFFAFKMYTNYDDQGSRFGDLSVFAQSSDDSVISTYAALDSKTGKMHLMLINKDSAQALPVHIYWQNFSPGRFAERYVYAEDNLTAIRESSIRVTPDRFMNVLPAYSITHLVIEPGSQQ
jgi:hypothetical protein